METSYEQWQPVIFLLALLVGVIIFVLCILFVRWVFRINEMADCLKRIADKISPLSLPKCDGCGKIFAPIDLFKIESGQLLCLQCYKMLENKKREKV
jgi:hypothetical protein